MPEWMKKFDFKNSRCIEWYVYHRFDPGTSLKAKPPLTPQTDPYKSTYSKEKESATIKNCSGNGLNTQPTLKMLGRVT